MKKTYDLAVTADANAKAAVVTATARLSATAAACKVAAFGVAQTAYSDKLAYDAGLAAIQASVKKAYAAKANFPASGKGALCNYKKPASATAEKGERL